MVEISLLGSEGARAGNRPGYPTSRDTEVRRLFSWTRQSYLHPTGIPGDSEDP